jgi:hypothetical protein
LKYKVFCIIQPGELEVLAGLLLCSLRHHLKGHSEISVFIPGTQRTIKELTGDTLDLLKKLDIPLLPFRNDYLEKADTFKEGDQFSNKYFPLARFTNGDYILFLDSDMLLLRDLDLSNEINGADFLAKPVCRMNENRWEQLYALFSLDIPKHRIRGTVDGVEGPPYFNGGLFAIRGKLAGKLFETWLDTFETINRSPIMEDNPFNREQAALSISVSRLGITYLPLTERHNFPARSKQVGKFDDPYFLHYHDPESLYKNESITKVVRGYFAEYPELSKIASRLKNWKIIYGDQTDTSQAARRLKSRLKGKFQDRKSR